MNDEKTDKNKRIINEISNIVLLNKHLLKKMEIYINSLKNN